MWCSWTSTCPHVNGIEGVTLIRTKYPDLKVLMQTVFEDDDKIFAAICAGADGYILKQANPLKLIEAIAEVFEGGAPMTPVVARKVLQLFSKQNKPYSEAAIRPHQARTGDTKIAGKRLQLQDDSR
jgi:DNA-binding NarL/FixJ family response regulator